LTALPDGLSLYCNAKRHACHHRPWKTGEDPILMMWLQLSKRTLPIALLALVLLGGVAAPAGAQGLRAERPSYSVGDKWIRSDGAYDLIRIENARYVFAADGGREVHLTRDLGVAKVVRGGQTLLEMEPPPSPTWPLEVGQWGVSWLTLKTLDPQYGQSLVRLSWRVEAYEDVRVPAGVFKAYRIVQVVEPRFLAASPQARRIELAFWYAPAAQQLVRADGGDLGGLAFQTIALDRPGPTPLGVVLIDPKDKGHVTTDRITLTGRVTGGAGPLRIAVTVNGAEVAQQQEPGTPGKDVALSMPIKLVEGENSLIVTATDASGAMRQQGRVLFYDKPAAAMGEGGTIPFMAMLGKHFPDAQFLITGVLGPHSNAHGPNEFLHVPTGRRITQVIAQVLADHHARAKRD